jgi:signal peptidase II
MLKQKSYCKSFWYLLIALFVLLVDFLSKQWIVNNIQAYVIEDFINVIDGLFRIVHVHNKGAAFSFLAEHEGWQQWLFASLAIVISIFLMYLLSKTSPRSWFKNTSYALIIGGAIGNLYDRLVYGYVIDFLDFYIVLDGVEKHYPAFNIADCAICVGVGAIIITELFFSKKSS